MEARCPRCGTVVSFPEGWAPVYPSCGHGREAAPAAAAPPPSLSAALPTLQPTPAASAFWSGLAPPLRLSFAAAAVALLGALGPWVGVGSLQASGFQTLDGWLAAALLAGALGVLGFRPTYPAYAGLLAAAAGLVLLAKVLTIPDAGPWLGWGLPLGIAGSVVAASTAFKGATAFPRQLRAAAQVASLGGLTVVLLAIGGTGGGMFLAANVAVVLGLASLLLWRGHLPT